MTSAVLFDLDGTLIDSAPDIHALANRILDAEGAAPLSIDEARSFVGRGAPAFVAQMCAARELPKANETRLLAEFIEGYNDAVSLTQPYHGVREALDVLQASGHLLAICTNKPEMPARSVLAHLGLDHAFPVVLGGDSVARKKPDPQMLDEARRTLGAQRAIFVGDSEVDAETAWRAGLPFLLHIKGYRTGSVDALPHFKRFADFACLPALIDGAFSVEPAAGRN